MAGRPHSTPPGGSPGAPPEPADGPRLPPGRAATSFDIAHLAGVSQPTVSRALSGSPMVSEATRKRIEAIAAQLNYKVDKAASSLRKGRSDTLALLLFEDPTADDSLINPFFVAMLGAITREAKRAGFDLLVSFQQLSDDWHHDYEDSHRADGLILLGYGDWEVTRARLEALGTQGTHFVRWGPVEPGQPGTTIGSDNVTGGRQAAAHLVGLGRRRIAWAGDHGASAPEFDQRLQGVKAVLAEAGHPFDPALAVPAITTEEAGRQAALALAEAGRPFDAIVAASDLIAIGAMQALKSRGVDVPGDVAIVGFDDIPAAAQANPPLTTVAQDTQTAGRLLVEAVIGQIAGRPVSGRILPTRLVVRRSCGA